jgi:mannose-6-phosphate isomerase-like protein (cupin superfamily)
MVKGPTAANNGRWVMPTNNWMFGLEEAFDKLPDSPDVFRFHYGLRHGSMKVGLYAPRNEDPQSPHKQDELYIVIKGTGDFVKNVERIAFKPGDVIFVEAHAEHRFENFSPDFATWVIFWGPDGGEQ